MGSDLAKSEYPGLNSSGYNSSGRFGIGFYSVFMIASEVIVETRKFDQGLDTNIRLRFPNGLCLRPIVKIQRGRNTIVSTVIRIKIDDTKAKWSKDFQIRSGICGVPNFDVPYYAVVSNISAGLDVDVYYSEFSAEFKMIHRDINGSSFDVLKWLKDITFANFHGGTKYVDYLENNYQRIRKVEHEGKTFGLAFLNTLYDSQNTCFEITTVGGLSNFGRCGDRAEFVGCMFAEPNTAKRDGLLPDSYKKEWAEEQYKILYDNGLSEMDRLMLPYKLGKYGIDMTEEMTIRFVSKDKRVNSIYLKNFPEYLKEKNMKLVMPLSSFLKDDRMEYYIDYERSIELMFENEILFLVETNSNFLDLKKDDQQFYYNIFQCLCLVFEKYGYSIKSQIVENKAVLRLEGSCKAMIISVDNNL